MWMHIYPSLLQYDTTTPTYDYLPSFAAGLAAVLGRSDRHVPHRCRRDVVGRGAAHRRRRRPGRST